VSRKEENGYVTRADPTDDCIGALRLCEMFGTASYQSNKAFINSPVAKIRNLIQDRIPVRERQTSEGGIGTTMPLAQYNIENNSAR
jgi:hypothetical protein